MQLLQQRLKAGAAEESVSTTASAKPVATSQHDALLRLLWAAAACLAERCPPSSSATAITWLRSLVNRLAAVSPALGWAAVPGATLQQVVALLEGLTAHPAAKALASAGVQLQQLLSPDQWAVRELPLDLTRADAIMPALAAAGALAVAASAKASGATGGGTAATTAAVLWQGIEAQAARLAAARGALAAHEQLRGAEAAAANAVGSGTASLLQQSYWRHIHPKVPDNCTAFENDDAVLALLGRLPIAVEWLISFTVDVLQVRARQAAAHEAVHWLYPTCAALHAAAAALLADDAVAWSPALLEQVPKPWANKQ